jgi:cyclopropane fatty-acyl-phospholipid synthase-like methyltransferase
MGRDAVAVYEKQREVWDVSDDPRWRLTIYEPLYGGKIYANNGGPALVDYMGAYVGLGPEHSVLELGSGMGDACEYVAFRFGSRVTGVEMSPEQIERSRERHPDRVSRGYDFIEADMLQWEPSELYDVVYFGDMLGVAQDRPALLERVHRWLRPGGALAITDIVAGSGLTDEDRAFIWGADGFQVPSEVDCLAQIKDAGFQELEVTDQTDVVVAMQETILQASYQHKETLVDAVGMDEWLEWVETAKHYGRLFAERKLISLRIGTHRN